MTEPAEALERRIDDLRAAIRQAVLDGDRSGARALRADLRQAERAWDDAITDLSDRIPPRPGPVQFDDPAASPTGHGSPHRVVPRQAGPILPLREQVHQVLTLLGAPAAPKLIIMVQQAFHTGELVPARLTSLRRDEERSFRAAPHARPYYLCSALTADLLAPARGLLAVSTWPMATRIMGPLSPRVDFLTAAVRLAEHIDRLPGPNLAANRLLWRFASSIPGATGRGTDPAPTRVADAARAELLIHHDADRRHRDAAARRARDRLDDVEQLYGSRLRTVPATGT